MGQPGFKDWPSLFAAQLISFAVLSCLLENLKHQRQIICKIQTDILYKFYQLITTGVIL